MKLFLSISLILFCSIHQSVHSKAAIGPVSSQDTIIRLEKRVELNLMNLQNTIDDANSKLEIFRAEISRLDYDRKQLKRTKIRAAKIQEELEFTYQKQNAYRHLLTMIRQLKNQNDVTAKIQLKEIDKSLKVLDKNKLPKLNNLKPIPSAAFIRNQTAVYDQNISSFCNLTRSPDGKMIANDFENFFEFTDPNIATHFKDKDFLECQARFIKTKKEYFLEFRFLLNSAKAAALYGTIDPSNPSKIDFIDGDFIYLETYALTSGTIDPETGKTIYNVQYKLNREDIKSIRKKDINSFTILWTSGADQFEICKIDLLRNMFECIQKRKLQN